MRKILNRGAKRRLRRKHQTARRRNNRIQLHGMEPLEDRRLLSVTPDNNWTQLFNPNIVGGVTQTVTGKITVANGPDAALAVAINYTDTADLLLEIDLDNNGTFDVQFNEAALASQNGALGDGVLKTQTLAGAKVGELNSLVWIYPLGTNAMDQMIRVRITGGPSTDMLGTIGSYHGVDQTNPMGSSDAKSSASVAGETSISLVGVDPGNRTLDAVMALERVNAGGTPIAITLKADRLDTDPHDGNATKDQIEVLDDQKTTAPNAVIHGGVSSDDEDPGFAHDMNWGFISAGAAAFTHVAAEINMESDPDVVFYDGGDADKSYGIAIHAPKGPTIGPNRDTETLAQVIANQGALATGDDTHVGSPDKGVAGDDEDIVPATDIGTNGVLNGMLISKSMGNNQGTLNFTVGNMGVNDKAFVTVYIDWGRDGSFIDAIDQVIAGATVGLGPNSINFNIPDSSKVVPGDTAVRVRLHTAMMGEDKTIAWNDQHANDGEVEDFIVKLQNASSLHGVKFEDFDGDGTRDGGDTPLAGVAFDLFLADKTTPAKDLFGKDLPIQYSDAAGKFWFDNLAPGTYFVKEFTNLSDTNGDKIFDDGRDGTVIYKGDIIDQGLRPSSTAAKNGVTVTIDKQGQAKDLPQEFGNYIAGSIHGVKFHDLDGDGVWDSNEEAIKGIKFDLYKFVKTQSTVKFSGKTNVKYVWEYYDSAETDVHGEFWFANVDPGLYELFEKAPGDHMSNMEWIISTGQQQAKTGDSSSADHPLMILMNRDPHKSSSVFEIVSRREFVWQFGAASHPIDGLGDGKAGVAADGILVQGEIDYGKAKAALKNEVLAGGVASTIVDSKGFEQPDFTTTFLGTGQLEGQPAGNLQVWQRTAGAGTSTAVVQNAFFAPGGGNQAVKVTRAPGSVDRWGVPLTGYPLTDKVCVEFDMMVPGPAAGAAGQFGPFFGVESYDDTVVIALLGSLGVDGTTGDVLYQDANGFFTEAGVISAFGTWYNYDMIFDYKSQTYSIYRDDVLLKAGIEFVDNDKVGGGLNHFTDADITALTAAANSDALTGTAYFDKFTVKDCGTAMGPSLVYGNYKPGKIHGFKFEDTDLNSKFDGADTPMKDVWMILKDAGGNIIAGTKTDVDGKFWFEKLRPGTYTVSESFSTTPGSKLNQLGTDTDNDGKADILEDWLFDKSEVTLTLISGDMKDIAKDTFGNYQHGSIHGFKFRDTDGDGIWDKSATGDLKEPGLADVVMTLYKQSGGNWVVSKTAKTASNGEFAFTQLLPGKYEVIELPANNAGEMLSTGQGTKAPTGGGTAAQQFNILSRFEFVYQAGEADNNGFKIEKLAPATASDKDDASQTILHFGDFRKRKIVGFKYEDVDGNGSYNAAIDKPLANVKMELSGTDNLSGNPIKAQVALTDATGMFMFSDISPGSYSVKELDTTDTNGDTIPDKFQDMVLDSFVSDFSLLSGNKTDTPFDLATDPTAPERHQWGNFVLGSIHGVKFHDANGNGLKDDGEDWLKDIKFHLWRFLGSQKTHFPSNKTTTKYFWRPVDWMNTDIHGEFWFTGLGAGTYDVFEEPGDYVLKSGQPTDAPVQTVKDDPQTPNVDESVYLGKAPSANAFEIVSRREYVWQLDPTYTDVDPDTKPGVHTLPEGAQVLDAQYGAFNRPMDVDKNGKIDGIPGYLPGGPTGEFLTAYNKAALKVQVLADPRQNTPKNLWFGNMFLSSIHGFKFENLDNNVDSNGNGIFDPDKGDTGLADIWMLLINDKGEVVKATKTMKDDPATKDVDETGKFWFNGVLPGTYRVEESADSSGKWASDTNLDGTADVLQELIIDPFKESVTVSSKLNPDDRDFHLKHQWANYVLGSIHGVKFQDYDRDGKWDRAQPGWDGSQDASRFGARPDEPAWEGIRFHLYKLTNVTTKLLASNKLVTNYHWRDIDWMPTDLHGEFWFTGLQPGWYEVREEARPDLESTTGQPTGAPGLNWSPEGSDTAYHVRSRLEFVWEKDPDGRGPNGGPETGAINRPRDLNGDGIIDADEQLMAKNKSALKAEVLRGRLIYGNNFITGSIHGLKFHDIDADGLWDQKSPKGGPAAEPGLGGILIELHDKNGNVPVLANGKLARVRTMPNGQYWFEDVMPGTYTIHEVTQTTKDGAFTDSNGDGVNDFDQGMVPSTPVWTGPITIAPREEWVYTPGAAHLTAEEIAKGVHEVFTDGSNKNNVNEQLIFGNYITGSVHGFKFLDADADGVYEPEHWQDMPFEWGAFELIDLVTGKSLGVQYSDTGGEFWFTDLKPGPYRLRERPDLIDRNDLDGDGFPDIVDADKDGLPEQKGNGIPDDKEGLDISTHKTIDLQIWSGEELVWKPGAAHLLEIDPVHAEPDDYPDGPKAFPVNIEFGFSNLRLTEVISGDPIYSVSPSFSIPNGSDRTFGHEPLNFLDDYDSFGFAGAQGILQAEFAVPVRSVSINVIADSGNDRGVLVAYDIDGNFLGQVSSKLLSAGQEQTITFNAPGNSRIGMVQVAGDGLTASRVGLDKLVYAVDPLKAEKYVGTDLMFGNYYRGAVHGLKLQSDSNNPAPNIPIQLVDQWGQVIATTTTNSEGEYWFLDVKPGFYTINELPTPSIIVLATPVPVVVGHAQAIFSADIPSQDRMYYPGIQTPVSNHALTMRNLIEGSIHGIVCNQAGAPIAGYTVTLAGPENAQVQTSANGEFHFNDLTPGAYVVNVGGQLKIVVVGSGEEEVSYFGQAVLDPGQFETQNLGLKFVVNVVIPSNEGPRVSSVKVSSTEWTEDFLTVVDVDPVDLGYKIPTGAGQLDTLPWINVNEVHVTFSEDVVIGAGNISLHGVNVANYGGTVTYNASTFTATLKLANPIAADKLILHVDDNVADTGGNKLDGEWTNGTSSYPSGNGTAGADFNFRFNVLPGDSNRNGTLTGPTDGVLGSDVIKVRNHQFLTPADGAYSVFDDVNGSANISGVDVVAVRNRQFTGLPAGSPVAPAGSGASLDLVDSVFSGGDSGTVFGKSAVAGDAGDDGLLVLALSAASDSDDDSAFAAAADDGGDDGNASGSSIDELFAALGA